MDPGTPTKDELDPTFPLIDYPSPDEHSQEDEVVIELSDDEVEREAGYM